MAKEGDVYGVAFALMGRSWPRAGSDGGCDSGIRPTARRSASCGDTAMKSRGTAFATRTQPRWRPPVMTARCALWNVAQRREQLVLSVDSDALLGVAFAPDGSDCWPPRPRWSHSTCGTRRRAERSPTLHGHQPRRRSGLVFSLDGPTTRAQPIADGTVALSDVAGWRERSDPARSFGGRSMPSPSLRICTAALGQQRRTTPRLRRRLRRLTPGSPDRCTSGGRHWRSLPRSIARQRFPRCARCAQGRAQ